MNSDEAQYVAYPISASTMRDVGMSVTSRRVLNLRLTGVDPSYQKTFVSAVDSNVKRVATGYHEQIAALRASVVSP